MRGEKRRMAVCHGAVALGRTFVFFFKIGSFGWDHKGFICQTSDRTLRLLVPLRPRSQIGTPGKPPYWVFGCCFSSYFVTLILFMITNQKLPLNMGLLEKKSCDTVDPFLKL